MAATNKIQPEETEYQSLADKAYQILEESIVTLRLAPGTVLSEQKLAQELNVGRSPVREALQRLSYEGLVVVLPRRGVLVSEIDISGHLRMLAVRRELEGLMVRSACDFATEEERGEFLSMARLFEKVAKENDTKKFIQIDAGFNKLLLTSANNEFIEKSVRLMSGLTRRFWCKYRDIADHAKCARIHAKIARAIAKNNKEACSDALHQLIDYLEKLTMEALVKGK